jgi:pimeloyl-ACP methyl ester carboxylesterase
MALSKLIWNLDKTVETSAGSVATGSIGDGPNLILAHGWPWSSYSWHRIIPLLAKHYRVHWYDMPGYGRSEKLAEQRTSLDIQGEVFKEMLTHWGVKKPLVVAHDFGGATTLRAHLLHDCEFSRYILMNVVAMRPWGSDFFTHVGRHVEAFLGLPSHIHEAVVRAYIKGALVNDIEEYDVDNLAAPWLSNEGRVSFYGQFTQADEKYTAEIEPDFGSIRCPVDILWGEDDPWIPLERGRALYNSIPHASFGIIQGVGHLPQLETPEKVAARLISILSN